MEELPKQNRPEICYEVQNKQLMTIVLGVRIIVGGGALKPMSK